MDSVKEVPHDSMTYGESTSGVTIRLYFDFPIPLSLCDLS
jgi:hypothetical protein